MKQIKNKLNILILLFLIMPYNSISQDTSLLTENEKNSVNIFQNTVNSVVNVSSIAKREGGLFYPDMEMPAGAGSGFVWDRKGHIVTNFHVIQHANRLQVSFHNDKNQYMATIVGVEPKKDIAVLKLKKLPKNLNPINVGISKSLLVGQKVCAIGNPFGLDHTMTTGIVSAVERKVEGIGGVKIHGMIQTDAAINPGNSGGPLLNSRGELIGMNTQILSRSGTSSGVGFAVPVDTIKRIVPQLIKHGKIIRPGLGIGILPDHVKMRYGIEKGIVISHLDPNGAAATAGLQGMGQDQWGRIYLGDIILKIGGKSVNTYDDIYHSLDKYKINDKVEVHYLRESKVKKVTVKLGEIY